jgi:hypothetical protein
MEWWEYSGRDGPFASATAFSSYPIIPLFRHSNVPLLKHRQSLSKTHTQKKANSAPAREKPNSRSDRAVERLPPLGGVTGRRTRSSLGTGAKPGCPASGMDVPGPGPFRHPPGHRPHKKTESHLTSSYRTVYYRARLDVPGCFLMRLKSVVAARRALEFRAASEAEGGSRKGRSDTVCVQL